MTDSNKHGPNCGVQCNASTHYRPLYLLEFLSHLLSADSLLERSCMFTEQHFASHAVKYLVRAHKNHAVYSSEGIEEKLYLKMYLKRCHSIYA
jgi:hypothetical protein